MVKTWLAKIRAALTPISDSAGLDAQVLLAHILGCPRAWLLAHPQATLTAPQVEALELALERLAAGEPLPYVLGRWEFFGLEFQISAQTLIPRPETELLVEQALAWLLADAARTMVIDVGAGSGCIAVTLAVKLPWLQVVAADLSREALLVAAGNAIRHSASDRVHIVAADLLSPFRQCFDLICANPPYIPSGALEKLSVARWEPHLALDGGPGGLELAQRLMSQAKHALSPGGLLLVEIGSGQGDLVLEWARKAFPGGDCTILHDLAGHERLLRVQSAG